MVVGIYIMCYMFYILYFMREKHLRPALSARHLETLPATGYIPPPVCRPATCIHPLCDAQQSPIRHPTHTPEGVKGIEPF